MPKGARKEEILGFHVIRVFVPQKLLKKCFYGEDISYKERVKIGQKIKEFEKALFQIQHVISVVGQIQTKTNTSAFKY